MYFFWVITLATGLYLMIFYIPTKEQAYDSIMRIQHHVPMGGLIRGLHKYAGDAIIILMTVRVYRLVFTGEYKSPKELTYVLAIVGLLLGMYSGLTGYLLIWNQRAYWASKVFVTFPTYLDAIPQWHHFDAWPVMGWVMGYVNQLTQVINDMALGRNTAHMLVGGGSLGQATITRFYCLHFMISIVTLILVEIRFHHREQRRMNLTAGQMIAGFAVLLVVTLLLPAESGSRANPTVTPLPILSDWYFLAMYQMLKYQTGFWATMWTMALPAVAVGVLVADRGPERSPWKRPFFTIVASSAMLYWIVFSFLIIGNIANIDRDPPYWYGSMVLLFGIGALLQWWRYRRITYGIALVLLGFYQWIRPGLPVYLASGGLLAATAVGLELRQLSKQRQLAAAAEPAAEDPPTQVSS